MLRVKIEVDGVSFTPGVFIAASLSYQAKDVELHISRTNVAVMAAQAFGGDVTRNNAAAAVQKSASVAVAVQVLDSLSGQIHASAQALTFQQSQAINRDLANHLSMLGSQPGGHDGTGLWVSAIGASGKLSQSGYASGDTSLCVVESKVVNFVTVKLSTQAKNRCRNEMFYKIQWLIRIGN